MFFDVHRKPTGRVVLVRLVKPTATPDDRAQCLRAWAETTQAQAELGQLRTDPRTMILLDSNVLIYAFGAESEARNWADA